MRRQAIELYASDTPAVEICRQLGVSRSWLYKWLKRSKTNQGDWSRSRSRRPRNTSTRLDVRMERRIVAKRHQLVQGRFYQYGPQAIYYALHQEGLQPPPIWTIARTLKRHGLTDSGRSGRYVPKGKAYPYTYFLCHQMDFVGPRYLASKERYYFLNLIGCDTHMARTTIVQQRTSRTVCEAVIDFWKAVGVPDFLQMDNELGFWGSLRHPTAVGRLIRLCLSLGVTPVFIPQSEPWRNGVIEHFNRKAQAVLLEPRANLAALRQAALEFDRVHNATHRYSSQNGQPPREAFRALGYPIQALPQSYRLAPGKLPLEEGEIHVIRFVRSDGKFHVFGLSYPLPEEAVHEYVLGIILVAFRRICFYLGDHYLTSADFEIQ